MAVLLVSCLALLRPAANPPGGFTLERSGLVLANLPRGGIYYGRRMGMLGHAISAATATRFPQSWTSTFKSVMVDGKLIPDWPLDPRNRRMWSSCCHRPGGTQCSLERSIARLIPIPSRRCRSEQQCSICRRSVAALRVAGRGPLALCGYARPHAYRVGIEQRRRCCWSCFSLPCMPATNVSADQSAGGCCGARRLA